MNVLYGLGGRHAADRNKLGYVQPKRGLAKNKIKGLRDWSNKSEYLYIANNTVTERPLSRPVCELIDLGNYAPRIKGLFLTFMPDVLMPSLIHRHDHFELARIQVFKATDVAHLRLRLHFSIMVASHVMQVTALATRETTTQVRHCSAQGYSEYGLSGKPLLLE